MSLVIASRFDGGIILAADAFVFDNNSAVTMKHLDFNKIAVFEKRRLAAVGIGSSWVFQQAVELIKDSSQPFDLLMSEILEPAWRRLNQQWLADRQKEPKEKDSDEWATATLRPLSKSTLIIARQDDLEELILLDPEGKQHKTKTFLFSGSGTAILQSLIKSKSIVLNPYQCLDEQISKILIAYKHCRHDLFCSGVPTFVVITKNRVMNYQSKCLGIFEKNDKKFFTELKKLILCK